MEEKAEGRKVLSCEQQEGEAKKMTNHLDVFAVRNYHGKTFKSGNSQHKIESVLRKCTKQQQKLNILNRMYSECSKQDCN